MHVNAKRLKLTGSCPPHLLDGHILVRLQSGIGINRNPEFNLNRIMVDQVFYDSDAWWRRYRNFYG